VSRVVMSGVVVGEDDVLAAGVGMPKPTLRSPRR